MTNSTGIPLAFGKVYGDDNCLSCPSCGGVYLHQTHLDSWFREENSDVAMHVSTNQNQVRMDHYNSGNPSTRRDGVLIRFECEQCPATPSLAIVQHKGHTLFEWHTPSEHLDD
jgi:Zn-finger nucleic acid-binding protein